jgi:hypothetical protein
MAVASTRIIDDAPQASGRRAVMGEVTLDDGTVIRIGYAELLPGQDARSWLTPRAEAADRAHQERKAEEAERAAAEDVRERVWAYLATPEGEEWLRDTLKLEDEEVGLIERLL